MWLLNYDNKGLQMKKLYVAVLLLIIINTKIFAITVDAHIPDSAPIRLNYLEDKQRQDVD